MIRIIHHMREDINIRLVSYYTSIYLVSLQRQECTESDVSAKTRLSDKNEYIWMTAFSDSPVTQKIEGTATPNNIHISTDGTIIETK